MIRGDSIPIELIIEILSRLPTKSIARFSCVSKLWESMFLRPYFTELFLTRSSARPPRLLFAVEGDGDEWCFFTSSQPQSPSSSLVVTADFHMKFLQEITYLELCRVSGLIYIPRHTQISTDVKHPVICNPSTGQFSILPLPKGRAWESFLGFDQIGKQFKVLSISYPKYLDEEEYEILTLGTGNNSWRTIHGPLDHFPRSEGICINGVLYYITDLPSPIVCFDVRSEKFNFINRDVILQIEIGL